MDITGTTSFDINMYDYFMEKYKEEGSNIQVDTKNGYIPIKSMSDKRLNFFIKMLNYKERYTDTTRAWIEIAESEKLIRRFNKINKIKDKIS